MSKVSFEDEKHERMPRFHSEDLFLSSSLNLWATSEICITRFRSGPTDCERAPFSFFFLYFTAKYEVKIYLYPPNIFLLPPSRATLAPGLRPIKSPLMCNCITAISPLFTKLPWPLNRKGILRSSSQAATCLSHTVETSHCPFCC